MVQHRTKTQIATGIEETWANVKLHYARVIPLAVNARAEYAQVTSGVSHEVEIPGRVELALGDDRLVWMTGSSKVLELAEPCRYGTGLESWTRIAVKELGVV